MVVNVFGVRPYKSCCTFREMFDFELRLSNIQKIIVNYILVLLVYYDMIRRRRQILTEYSL